MDNLAKWRNGIGFWLLGLCNNYPYVIMLSAAHDILSNDFNNHGTHDQPNSSNSSNVTEPFCNPHSSSTILLADILPSLSIKIVAPFFISNTHIRVSLVVGLAAASFLITSYSSAIWMSFLGVICASFSSGLGEVTFLAYSSFFDPMVISFWSSGTGGAGVAGALSYAALTQIMPVRDALLLMIAFPLVMAISFWWMLKAPKQDTDDRKPLLYEGCCSGRPRTESDPINNSPMEVESIRQPKPQISLKEKLRLIKPLLKFMIPLGLVYFLEYYINQGLYELIYFPGTFLDHKAQYRWFQVLYQVGVFISRSSLSIITIDKLWIMPCLQACNVVLMLVESIHPWMPCIWFAFLVILFEGLLGGGAYVNTFYKISRTVDPKHKEFSMSIASTGDSFGIALAAVAGIPTHDALCKLH